ncbi:unnamed protein product [Sphenostylis stenocarpa]|uniref:Uncharacterized protein n=1 Tax=Sphenostylis stenocarpa TaxID=92480 RepID=A0AA87B869_9FABA|nr:unnamed protein product [Sphenostylis stenocarpa]
MSEAFCICSQMMKLFQKIMVLKNHPKEEKGSFLHRVFPGKPTPSISLHTSFIHHSLFLLLSYIMWEWGRFVTLDKFQTLPALSTMLHNFLETVGESRPSKHDDPDGGAKDCPVKKGEVPS